MFIDKAKSLPTKWGTERSSAQVGFGLTNVRLQGAYSSEAL